MSRSFGAISDRHSSGQRETFLGRETAQGSGLSLAIHDLADQAAREETVAHLEPVGVGVVDPKLRSQRSDDLDETSRDDGNRESESLQGAHEGARTSGQPYVGAHLVQDAHRKAGEDGHPRTQALGEVELAAHGGGRDGCDL